MKVQSWFVDLGYMLGYFVLVLLLVIGMSFLVRSCAPEPAHAHVRPNMPYTAQAIYPAPVDAPHNRGIYLDTSKWVAVSLSDTVQFYICWPDSVNKMKCISLPPGFVLLIPKLESD